MRRRTIKKIFNNGFGNGSSERDEGEEMKGQIIVGDFWSRNLIMGDVAVSNEKACVVKFVDRSTQLAPPIR